VSTHSVVAFDDGKSVTGIYVHSDGHPEDRLPVLRDIYTNTFFRDLTQLRTVLLKHRAGWSALSTDTAFTADWATHLGHGLDVPGVGVAYTEDDIDMTCAEQEVFGQEYTYVFDLADASLSVYDGRRQIMHIPEAGWAPIGPLCLAPTLPIVAADPIGELCLTGVAPAYHEAHISALMHALHLTDGEQLLIGDGGDLNDFFDAAVTVGLLPGTVWFFTDGGQTSRGGWLRLPIDLEGVDIQAMLIEAEDFDVNRLDEHRARETRFQVRELLEFMAARIATATTSVNTWRAPDTAYVLNIRHPDEGTYVYTDGPEPKVYTLDFGAVFCTRPSDAATALSWVGSQIAWLHDWPLRLRQYAAEQMQSAVDSFPAAEALAGSLAEDEVNPAAIEHARFVGGWLNAGPEDGARQAALDAWLAERTAPAPEPGYADACRRATTAQGLDPIIGALAAAGVVHDVEQTGGFCMMVRVPTPRSHHFGITVTEQSGTDRSGHWLVVRYSDIEYDDGEVIGEAMPTDEVIALLRAHLPAALTLTGPAQSAPAPTLTGPEDVAVRPEVVQAVTDAVNTAVDQLKEELDVWEGAVDDLLNLVVNASAYAAAHPHDATLADAIEANYDGSGCEECDDPDDCEDPEHHDVVTEVLGWLNDLR
jgi:hypothetical protein